MTRSSRVLRVAWLPWVPGECKNKATTLRPFLDLYKYCMEGGACLGIKYNPRYRKSEYRHSHVLPAFVRQSMNYSHSPFSMRSTEHHSISQPRSGKLIITEGCLCCTNGSVTPCYMNSGCALTSYSHEMALSLMSRGIGMGGKIESSFPSHLTHDIIPTFRMAQ